MQKNERQVECGKCGQRLIEANVGDPLDRKPCPGCGSLQRRVRLSLSGTLALYTKLKGKVRGPKGGRARYEFVQGDDLHQKTGRWTKLKRIIDRAGDWYQEIVTDPATGDVVHQEEVPLSRHRGHGSAKQRQTGRNGKDD